MTVLRVMPNGVGPYGVWTNIWDIRGPGSDYEDAQEAVDFVANAYFDYWRPYARNNYFIQTFKVAALGTGLPAIEVTPAVGTVTGANTTGDNMPAQIALLLRFTAVAARPNRARKYLPGFTEAHSDSTRWAVALQTPMLSFVAEMVDMVSLSTSGLEFGVARPPAGVGFVTFTPLTAGSIDTYPVTQRRRRRNV